MKQTGGASSNSITKLKDKDNNPAWSTKMEALLDKLDFFEHIEDSDTTKFSGDALAKWNKADRRANTEIILAVSDDVVHIVPRQSSVRDAWLLLQNEYECRHQTTLCVCFNIVSELRSQLLKNAAVDH